MHSKGWQPTNFRVLSKFQIIAEVVRKIFRKKENERKRLYHFLRKQKIKIQTVHLRIKWYMNANQLIHAKS